MTHQELLSKIQSGELPPAGIIRRSNGAKDVKVTTVHNGQTVEVPDITIDVALQEPPVTENEDTPESHEESN